MLLKTFTSLVCFFLYFNLISQEFIPVKKSISIPTLEEYCKKVYENSNKNISKDYSKDQKAFLKKNNEERYNATLKYIKQGAIIDNGYIYEKVDSIFQLIISTNPTLSKDKKIYLINEPTANAFTFGDNVIYIHLGLLYRVTNIEELILVICHEIAHNEMQHYDKKNIDYAKNIINDSLERELKKIYRKEFGHVSALNELFTPWILSNKVQSRAFENEADSLAITYMKNANLNLKNAQSIYKILKNIEKERDTLILNLEKDLNLPKEIDFSKHLSYEKGSSLGVFTKTEDTLKVLLRTHPFPEEREAKFLKDFENSTAKTSIESFDIKTFKYFIECEMVQQTMDSKNIGKAIFYWIQLQKKYPEDNYLDHFLSYAFSILAYEKTARREGKVLENSEINFDENYDRLLYFLKKLNPKECLDLAKHYVSKIDNDSSSEFVHFAQAVIFGMEKDAAHFKHISEKIDTQENRYNYIIKEIRSKFE